MNKEEAFDLGNTENVVEERKVGKKRNYHNILERKRRNHIKDGYLKLRDAVPNICGKKVSRIQILKRAIEYIREQEEEIGRREARYQEMKDRSQLLKRVVDFIKTKDLGCPSY